MDYYSVVVSSVMPNHDHINEAITKYLVLLWFTDEFEHNIEANYGKDVLNTIKAICAFAANSPIWSNDDDIAAFNDTIEALKLEYPYLTGLATIHIANIAAYFWK